MTDRPMESATPSAGPGAGSGTPPPRPVADDFQPDIPADEPKRPAPRPPNQVNRDIPGDARRAPTPFEAPRGRSADSAGDDVHLVPGARIAGGRYRLLVFHGGAPPLQFWQALDTALDRQVALTFVDPDGALPDEVLQEILSRTLRLSRIDKPGIARVLDVVHVVSGGIRRTSARRFERGRCAPGVAGDIAVDLVGRARGGPLGLVGRDVGLEVVGDRPRRRST
ncbi:hypothetical protein A5620_25760 [Mycobacterium colombiense]|nr:hypothetical protein A5620_25760 [Mycobacterium colombiense]